MRSSGCGLVEPACSSHMHWRAGQPARGRRAAANAALTERIRALHKADPTMGSPRTDRRPQRGFPAKLCASES